MVMRMSRKTLENRQMAIKREPQPVCIERPETKTMECLYCGVFEKIEFPYLSKEYFQQKKAIIEKHSHTVKSETTNTLEMMRREIKAGIEGFIDDRAKISAFLYKKVDEFQQRGLLQRPELNFEIERDKENPDQLNFVPSDDDTRKFFETIFVFKP